MELVKKHGFLALCLVIIGLRFLHFEPEIDSPHAWRQCDTHQYITSFHDDGIDLLHPSVCWMGGHKTLLLEFPLPEAVVAIAYSIFGESLWLGRFIFLVFFGFCALYVFKSLKLFYDDGVSKLATVVFMLSPLALFYSRAIHIDFCAMGLRDGHVLLFLKGLYRGELAFTLLWNGGSHFSFSY